MKLNGLQEAKTYGENVWRKISLKVIENKKRHYYTHQMKWCTCVNAGREHGRMGVRYNRTPLVKMLPEHRSVTGQVHSDMTITSLCFFSRPMPMWKLIMRQGVG